MGLIVNKVEILFIKKKSLKSKLPLPSYFHSGFSIFKLYTNQGTYGLGEPSTYAGNFNEIISSTKIVFNEIKGKDLRILSFDKIKKKLSLKFKKKLPLSASLAGLSHCVFDILGKVNSKPINKILENRNYKNKIKLYASGGMIYHNQSFEFLLNEALSFKKKNFFGWKFRPPFPKDFKNHMKRMKIPPPIRINKLIEISQRLRLNLGDNFNLMMDLGCRCRNKKEFQYLLSVFTELNFFFIEEPFKRSLRNYKNLTSPSSPNISAGENLHDYKDILKWRNKNFLDLIQLDLNLNDIHTMHKLFKNYTKKPYLLPHNWNNNINESVTYNFLNSLKIKRKEVIVEKNILKNPYERLFINKCFRIKNGTIEFKNYNGHGILLKKIDLKKFKVKRIII